MQSARFVLEYGSDAWNLDGQLSDAIAIRKLCWNWACNKLLLPGQSLVPGEVLHWILEQYDVLIANMVPTLTDSGAFARTWVIMDVNDKLQKTRSPLFRSCPGHENTPQSSPSCCCIEYTLFFRARFIDVGSPDQARMNCAVTARSILTSSKNKYTAHQPAFTARKSSARDRRYIDAAIGKLVTCFMHVWLSRRGADLSTGAEFEEHNPRGSTTTRTGKWVHGRATQEQLHVPLKGLGSAEEETRGQRI